MPDQQRFTNDIPTSFELFISVDTVSRALQSDGNSKLIRQIVHL